MHSCHLLGFPALLLGYAYLTTAPGNYPGRHWVQVRVFSHHTLVLIVVNTYLKLCVQCWNIRINARKSYFSWPISLSQHHQWPQKLPKSKMKSTNQNKSVTVKGDTRLSFSSVIRLNQRNVTWKLISKSKVYKFHSKCRRETKNSQASTVEIGLISLLDDAVLKMLLLYTRLMRLPYWAWFPCFQNYAARVGWKLKQQLDFDFLKTDFCWNFFIKPCAVVPDPHTLISVQRRNCANQSVETWLFQTAAPPKEILQPSHFPCWLGDSGTPSPTQEEFQALLLYA